MVDNDVLERNDQRVSEPTYLKPSSSDGSDKFQAAQSLHVVLDMGEASREQGFRLNGCR